MADKYLEELLGKNENINLVARQHWLVYVQSILPEILIIILLVVGISLSIINFQESWIWFSSLLIIFPIVSIVRDTLLWLNRKYVITNHRVIQVSGVINKDVTDSSLEKVNDVKLVQTFWGRLFGYGTIQIMTASELGINLFNRIANPIKFKTTMLDAKDKEGDAVGELIASNVISLSIPEMIIKLGELRDKGLLTEAEFQSKKKELLTKISAA